MSAQPYDDDGTALALHPSPATCTLLVLPAGNLADRQSQSPYRIFAAFHITSHRIKPHRITSRTAGGTSLCWCELRNSPAYVWTSTRCRQPAGIRRAERRRGPNNCPGARPGAPAVASCSSYCKQVRVPTWWYLRLASGLVQGHRTVAAQVPAGQRQACRGEEAGEADWPFGASSGTRGWSGGSGSSIAARQGKGE
ncbi:hypothetical protein HDV62DRAFT_98980 [Trichoderma sp. SZMC 28011]